MQPIVVARPSDYLLELLLCINEHSFVKECEMQLPRPPI